MTLADRVAHRFTSATCNNINIPPRMHLRSDAGYLVWLEGDAGTRVFEPNEPMPGTVLRQLYQAVLRDRPHIEAQWVRDVMVPNNWLDVAIQQDVAVVICYPGMVIAFRRELDLTAWAETLGLEELLMAQVDPDTCDIVLYGNEGSTGTIPIWSVLWVSDTDPSLATFVPDEHPHELVVPF